MTRIGPAALTLLLALLMVVAVASLEPGSVDASEHSAERTFAASWVAPGGQVQITITVMDYGVLGQVEETIPRGFRYVQSSLAPAAVTTVNGAVTFTLLGDEGFTYTVEAPAAEGSYTFAGVLRDQARDERQIGGQTGLRVGPPPTPAPTPTPEPTATPEPTPTTQPVATATPEPTLTPEPIPTATPAPTATPTPAPTATLEPTPTPEPVPTATPEPTPAPEPIATATPEPTLAPPATPAPISETPGDEGGVPLWIWGVLVPIALVLIFGGTFYARRRR